MRTFRHPMSPRPVAVLFCSLFFGACFMHGAPSSGGHYRSSPMTVFPGGPPDREVVMQSTSSIPRSIVVEAGYVASGTTDSAPEASGALDATAGAFKGAWRGSCDSGQHRADLIVGAASRSGTFSAQAEMAYDGLKPRHFELHALVNQSHWSLVVDKVTSRRGDNDEAADLLWKGEQWDMDLQDNVLVLQNGPHTCTFKRK